MRDDWTHQGNEKCQHLEKQEGFSGNASSKWKNASRSICCRYLHRLELLSQAQEKYGKLTGKQPATIEITRRDYWYQVALLLYKDTLIWIIRLWWPSQWLVTYVRHLPVITYLHVVPSPSRHTYFCKKCLQHIKTPLHDWLQKLKRLVVDYNLAKHMVEPLIFIPDFPLKRVAGAEP